MLDLALHCDSGPVTLRDVARRQEVSERYLENIMTELAAGGYVRGVRGKGGGFVLGRPPQDIRLSQMVQHLEGSLAPAPCVDDRSGCERAELCVTCDIWTDVKEAILGVLDSVTLADMAETHRKKAAEQGPLTYVI